MFTDDSNAGVQVDFVPFAFVDPGEEPQVFDDLLDSTQPFACPVDELRKVAQCVVEIELFAQLIDLAQSRLVFGFAGF